MVERCVIYLLRHFRYWCYKVLPLVYDDSLSYYEVLCKVVDYINKLIDQDKIFGADLTELRNDLSTVQTWIENFDTSYAEEIIRDQLAKMIFVEISNDGHFIYYIPDGWDDLSFRTTMYDYPDCGYDYGHLVLIY